MGLLSALSRRGANRVPLNAIFPHLRQTARWQPPQARETFTRYLRDRNNGPMAMGAADLAERTGRAHSLPLDMGMAALGGGAGIMGLNQLALGDGAITDEQRAEGRRVRRLLQEIERAQREEAARQTGHLGGLEQANSELTGDLYRMRNGYEDEPRYGR